MATKICPCCGKTFQPHHKVPNQIYCSSPDCQRERRQLWDRKKQQTDPEYRDNKNRVQRAWSDRNPDYWRKYRKANPDVVEKILPSSTSRSQTDPVLAKMDDLASLLKIPAGVYRIKPVSNGVNGSSGSWIVEITPACCECPCQADDCQDRM